MRVCGVALVVACAVWAGTAGAETVFRLPLKAAGTITVAPSSADPCAVAPSPGTLCADGTRYVGPAPVGGKLYTTAADLAPSTWNDGSDPWPERLIGGATLRADETGAEAMADGLSATGALAGLTGAETPNQAAQACWNLSAAGHGDWYLPAFQEAALLHANRAALGIASSSFYWTPFERAADSAWLVSMADGGINYAEKADTFQVRCVRRGP